MLSGSQLDLLAVLLSEITGLCGKHRRVYSTNLHTLPTFLLHKLPKRPAPAATPDTCGAVSAANPPRFRPKAAARPRPKLSGGERNELARPQAATRQRPKLAASNAMPPGRRPLVGCNAVGR